MPHHVQDNLSVYIRAASGICVVRRNQQQQRGGASAAYELQRHIAQQKASSSSSAFPEDFFTDATDYTHEFYGQGKVGQDGI
jgi:hypothetical protein